MTPPVSTVLPICQLPQLSKERIADLERRVLEKTGVWGGVQGYYPGLVPARIVEAKTRGKAGRRDGVTSERKKHNVV